MKEITLNENEHKVLAYLVDEVEDVWGEKGYVYFSTISKATGLEVKVVRRVCRSLKRKGLAEFMRGLFNEDGEVAGSGYGATDAGLSFLAAETQKESTRIL